MSEKQAGVTSMWGLGKIQGFFLPILLIVLLGGVTLVFLAERGDQISNPVTSVEGKGGPAKVVPVEGTDLSRVILTERAAERLDIQTELVRDQELNGVQRLVIPYSAVIYGLYGETWAYISPEPLTYVRESITVDYIEGDIAVLTEGPIAGTEVVTVGVAELYGTETGVGK